MTCVNCGDVDHPCTCGLSKSRSQVGFRAYQEEARRTANQDMPGRERLCNWALGLSGEVGELNDHIKKFVFSNHELDREYAQEELGDILFYLSNMASELGLDLGTIAERNNQKLRLRYPDGYSDLASQERRDKVGR